MEPMISIPLAEYEALKALVVSLSEEVRKLKEDNNLLRNGRKSNTSSTPPSHDIGRSNVKNSRIKTGRKPGGQKGHAGATLEIKAMPDEIIDYQPNYCSCCGFDLQNEHSIISECKQEVIIPRVEGRYVEHRSHTKTCTQCGKECMVALPERLKAAIQYGPSVATAVVYYSTYHYIPYNRIATILWDMYKIPISEGSIDNMLERSMEKAKPAYQYIQNKIAHSTVIGADETGCKIAAKKGWFWTWQNSTATFIVASFSRGYDTIETNFKDGFPYAVYVSDCLPAQLKTPALHHQLCVVHLLREVANFIDALSCNWSKEMKKLLQDAIHLKHELKEEDYTSIHPGVVLLEQRLTDLLAVDYSASHQKVQAFTKRLIKNRNSIFQFLYHMTVPADNNGSERAVRNIKVKTKVSSQFRTERGAERYAVIRSVVDTSIKNSQNVYDAITALENLSPP